MSKIASIEETLGRINSENINDRNFNLLLDAIYSILEELKELRKMKDSMDNLIRSFENKKDQY